jgi:2-amino-4-hydroxy-6-hydroxymethyldihydropteridine diphosphokinase
MILIGIGANLPSKQFGTPLKACEAAVAALEEEGLRVVGRSRWYRSEPVPKSDQPWYVNGVVAVETDLPAEEVLSALHRIEARFGRVRRERNEARIIDLDLLAYDDQIVEPQELGSENPRGLRLPHPRLTGRAFVLLPLADVSGDWRHPASGRHISDLIAALPPDQIALPIDE